MTPSEKALNLAREFEGCYLTAYLDPVDIWTLGYGRTLNVFEGETCTQEQADAWLDSDMADAGDWVSRLVTSDINQNQYDALCDLFFNVGHEELETSHLLKYVNARQFDAAANEFPKWCHADGVVLPGLVTRRAAEQQLFLS